MLKLCLNQEDSLCHWKPADSGWRAGRSYIEPFSHNALEAFAFSDEHRSLFIVRERLRGKLSRQGASGSFPLIKVDSTELTTALKDAREWPLDYILILSTREPDGLRVAIDVGPWGTAPVYLLESDDTLWGSWDPADLYPHTKSNSLDAERLAHFLVALEFPYSTRTLFPEIRLLTERSRALWHALRSKSKGLIIEYPKAIAFPHPRALKPNADVLGGFHQILASSMSRWLDPEYPQVSTELSGGLDSSVVSAVGASLSSAQVHTYGLIMPGHTGAKQKERRDELIKLFRFLDLSLPAEEYPPLSFENTRIKNNRMTPWHEIYYEAFEQMLRLAFQRNTRIIFTGVGGDELCLLYKVEIDSEREHSHLDDMFPEGARIPEFLSRKTRDIFYDTVHTIDRAPFAPIPESALESAASASTLYLSNGIWPVNPLCTPELVRFCRSLPLEWRQGRTLEKRLLARLGCSRSVTDREVEESFSDLLALGLKSTAQPFIRVLFSESQLAEMGYVDREKLLASYTDYCVRGAEVAEEVYLAIILIELTLKALEASRSNKAS